MPKLLLQVYVRELHDGMVSPPQGIGLKEARDEDNDIIISDSIFLNILPPQLKNMTSQCKVKWEGGQVLHIYQKHAFIIIIMA